MNKKNRSNSTKKNVLVKKDPTGRLHFVYSSTLGSATQRFEAFQNWTVKQGIGLLEPCSLLVSCLLAYDGFAIEGDISSAYAACANAAKWRGADRVDWLNGGRADARNLSCLTILALQRIQKWEPFSSAQQKFEEVLQSKFYSDQCGGNDTAFQILLSDSAAWLQHSLPPIFYGHISGEAPMSALARTVLTREQTHLALQDEKTGLSSIQSACPDAYAYALDAAMLGKPASARHAGAFLEKLLTALKPPVTGSVAFKRSSVTDAITLLSPGLDHIDEFCALLYLFALNLAESGTRRKNVLAPDTPHSYIRSFAYEFASEMDGQSLGNISPENYEKVFKALLDPLKNPASYRVAGLKAFHTFLRTWWSAPKLPKEVFSIDSSTLVAANVVWPHEYALIDCWFGETTSTRFSRQLHAALSISKSVMIRIQELMKLRLLNVVDEETQLCIEVAREIRDGKEKTTSGRRRVFVKDPGAIELIRKWCAQRISENATPDSYLFGDPSNPEKIADQGKMYFWMNRILQSVTGDDTVSMHTCRHTIASHRFDEIALEDDEHEINPTDLLAVEAGHVGGHITTVNYCHLYERGLRHWLDHAIYHLDLDYRTVAAWSGMSEVTLRKRVSRLDASSDLQTVFWDAFEPASKKAAIKNIGDGFPLVAPQNPMLGWQTKPLGFGQVTGILADVSAGLSTSQACLRHDVKQPLIESAMQIVGEFSDVHGTPELTMLDRLTLGITALKDKSGILLGMLPDFSRLSQPRWKLMCHAIEKADSPVLAEAVDYWQRALKRHHLAVRPGPGFEKILELIKAAQISTDLIQIRWSGSSASVLDALSLAQIKTRTVFGRKVSERKFDERGGRPAIWLVIGSDAESLAVDGSASSISGLHCALLAAHVWMTLQTALEKK